MKIDWDAGKPLTLLPRVGWPIYTGVSVLELGCGAKTSHSRLGQNCRCRMFAPISGGLFALLVLRMTCRLPAAWSIQELMKTFLLGILIVDEVTERVNRLE